MSLTTGLSVLVYTFQMDMVYRALGFDAIFNIDIGIYVRSCEACDGHVKMSLLETFAMATSKYRRSYA